MRFRHVFFLSFLSIFLLQGCAANKYDMIHYCLKEEPRIKPPQKFLLLPIDVSIVEITAGGNIEEVPSLTEQSRTYLYENITELLKSRPGLELVGLPDLPDEQKAVMDQHTALFDRVLDCRSYYLYISAFHHKLERPDSTIGEGLAFLGENTGADAAIIVSGGGFVSTTGRKVMSLLLTGAPMSGSGLDIGVIDLKTGNVLWTNSLLLQHMNLTNENTVKLIVKSLLSKFPDFQHIEVKKDA